MADYGNFKRPSGYRVKKPIRSFKDLEVYYRTEQASVRIIKDVMPHLADGKCPEKLKDQLLTCSLRIPQMIAESHSKRFDDKTLALKMLDEAKHACNTVVVYLEQVRDVAAPSASGSAPAGPAGAPASVVTVCNEIVREYAFTRVKILNLLKAWLKFEDRDQKITEARALAAPAPSMALAALPPSGRSQAAEYQATIRNQGAQIKMQQAEIEKLKAELAKSPSRGGPRHGG